ncbi:hypothetical protein IJ541_08650 [bacterium]|nr:hypothetical protein [bacterium]MBQ9246909.1 hypothetical protein [bacterium]
MSTIEKITQLSHRIFNTSVTEQNVVRSSNPFAASNFQKNILTEDVFESSKGKQDNIVSFTGNITAGSKRIYSTFVGSLGSIGNKFYEGIESIVEFCSRVKESFVTTLNKMQELGNREVGNFNAAREVLSRDIKSFFAINTREKEIAKMASMEPHAQIKPMLIESLSALEADMAKAA